MKLNPNLSTVDQITLLTTFDIEFIYERNTFFVKYNEDLIDNEKIVTENISYFKNIKTLLINRLNFESITSIDFQQQLEKLRIILINFPILQSENYQILDTGHFNYIYLNRLGDIEKRSKYEVFWKNYKTIRPIIDSQIQAIDELYNLIEKKINNDYIPIQNNFPYPDIFNSKIGYEIFCKMKEIYGAEKYSNVTNKDLANYSFLFYAMKNIKENNGIEYIVCGNTNFITFLEKFEIFIDKIDSRQKGKDNKFNVYKSIRDSVIEKNNKSTI